MCTGCAPLYTCGSRLSRFQFICVTISMRMMHYSSIACSAMKFKNVTAIFIQLNFVVNSEQDMGDIPNPSLRHAIIAHAANLLGKEQGCFTVKCLEHSMKAGKNFLQRFP